VTFPPDAHREIRITAAVEPIDPQFQDIYVVDAQGRRYGVLLLPDGRGNLAGVFDFSVLAAGSAVFHARAGDSVGNMSLEVEAVVEMTQLLRLDFTPPGAVVNPHGIGPNDYKKGTANLTPNSDKLVNRLWVKGGRALSEPHTQALTVTGVTPIPLDYSPRAPEDGFITVTVDGETKTLGVQNLDSAGEYDFLLNASEKILIPDLCTAGAGVSPTATNTRCGFSWKIW
jgi:hypothetical protein